MSIQHDETKYSAIEKTENKLSNLTINETQQAIDNIESETNSSDTVNEKLTLTEEQLDRNSQKYRLAMIEKALSDVRSMRTYTSASTIAPEVVKQQVKKNLDIKQKKSERKKAVAKGEASAVTRHRRDNRETIRESTGLWGWAE